MGQYTGKEIKKLEFPENVQKYVGMYLGGRDKKAKVHGLKEIFSNSLDEYTAGFGKKIYIKISEKIFNNKTFEIIEIKDNGRGIPIDKRKDGSNTLTYILTNLHTGGKIRGEKSAYIASGGLHGVGASVVLATSLYFEVIVAKKEKNKVVRQIFEKGYAKTEVEEISPAYFGSNKKDFLIVENFDGNLNIEEIQKENPDKYVIENGTIIRWIPWDKKDYLDFDGIFEAGNIDITEIKEYLDEICYLNPDLKVFLNYYSSKETFSHTGGIEEMLNNFLLSGIKKENIIIDKLPISVFIDTNNNIILNPNENKKYQKIVQDNLNNKSYKFVIIDGLLNLSITDDKIEKYFVNNIPTNGGIEKKTLFESLKKVIEKESLKNNILKSDEKLNLNLIKNIFNCIINLKINDPEFQGQTKNELFNKEIGILLKNFLIGNNNNIGFLENYFNQNKTSLKKIVDIVRELEKLENKEKNIIDKILKEKLNKIEKLKINSKLSDCRSENNEVTELYICEGDSAAGPIKNARNPEIQAVLPISGKIKNVIDLNSYKDLIDKKEDISSIITALGCGIGNNIDLDKLRYNKIILLSDADDDGYHITSLLLAFFMKFFKKVVENGHLYIGISPLYEITNIKNKKKIYIYNKSELDNWIETNKNNLNKYIIKRNKGLGEMSPKSMWESTLNPETRRLIKVSFLNYYNDLDKMKIFLSNKKNFIEKRKKFFINDL